MVDLSWLEKNTAGYEIVKSTTEPTIKYRVKCWCSKDGGIFAHTEWGITIEDAIHHHKLWFTKE